MNIYLVSKVIIQYYAVLLLKLFQLWPLEDFWVGSYVLLTYPHHCEFWGGGGGCFVLYF